MSTVASPLISVVIPTYNHAHYLGRCLQSVLDQTYENWEAIVIDNHSTDNTDEVMRNFADPRITLVKIHNDGVIAASRNMGVRAARGEWVAFLDSDDWWLRDKLQVCIANASSKTDLIYHDLRIVKEITTLFQGRFIKSWQVKMPVIVDLLVRGNAIATSSVVVRKSLFAKIGGIDENPNLASAEDYNTWLRIANITDGFKYVSKCLGFYMLHSQGMSRKDMSAPTKIASESFTYVLNRQQMLKYNSYLRYTQGRFAFVKGDFVNAKQDLFYCLRYGNFTIKFKSLLMLLTLKCNIGS